MASLITFIAFIGDWILGDPQRWPHPVRFVGKLISRGENIARAQAKERPARLRLAGAVLALSVVLITMIMVGFTLFVAGIVGYVLWFLVALYFVYSALCLKDLYQQTWRVETALKGGFLSEARQRLSWVVGRDTAKLDEPAVRRAVIETLAENFSDGLVAPMLYLAIGGPVLAWGYKAINTLDSMIGYKSDRFIDLGRFAAKLDDAANYIPARLAALLLVLSARLQGFDWRQAKRIWLRDGRLHSSPNSGHPEAAMAGALGLWLGGPGYYCGVLCDKPIINDGGGETTSDSVRSAERIVVGAALLMLTFCLVAMLALTGGWGWFL
ncbi:cobalamin biosynthesis protein CobD [Deltaproteobacteria bacterium Smac51]|nr:cobalamin biosynthesis protein CobD [Deltaproteobacteria bacterium Smac51]